MASFSKSNTSIASINPYDLKKNDSKSPSDQKRRNLTPEYVHLEQDEDEVSSSFYSETLRKKQGISTYSIPHLTSNF